MDFTLATIAAMVLSSSPRVARRATVGSEKNCEAMVEVPGSDVGKEARNCPGVHLKFCA